MTPRSDAVVTRAREDGRVEQIADYQEGYAHVVVSRDGDDLVFDDDFDDNGRSIVTQTRMTVSDFVAKGTGPHPWFDLGQRRPGSLLVLAALGVPPPAWTEPLPPEVHDLFYRAQNGWESIADLLAAGLDVDTVDPTGATPLWYAVWSLNPAASHVLIEAGADVGRRIELSASGDRSTTIWDAMVRLERAEAIELALARGFVPGR